MISTFKVSIGLNEENAPEASDYTEVKFDVELHKDKIEEKLASLKEKTGKYRVPMFILDFPESAKNLKLDFLQSDYDKEYSEVLKNGRIYRSLDFKEKDFVLFKKKIQKVFGKMTELDNKLFLHLQLHNVASYHQKLQDKQFYPISVFLEKAKIEGKIETDPNFFDLLTQLIQKISPKFANSPIMAVLPLFSGVEAQVQMDSLNQLEPEHREKIFGFKMYEEPDDDEEGKALLQAFNNSEKVYLHLSFESMGILTIELQVRMFAYHQCLT